MPNQILRFLLAQNVKKKQIKSKFIAVRQFKFDNSIDNCKSNYIIFKNLLLNFDYLQSIFILLFN